jgi:hypothetical protein
MKKKPKFATLPLNHIPFRNGSFQSSTYQAVFAEGGMEITFKFIFEVTEKRKCHPTNHHHHSSTQKTPKYPNKVEKDVQVSCNFMSPLGTRDSFIMKLSDFVYWGNPVCGLH